MFFFSIKGAILNTADLVRKNYNTFDLLLFVREGKGSAFTSKFCSSSSRELPAIGPNFFESHITLLWYPKLHKFGLSLCRSMGLCLPKYFSRGS